MVDVIKQMIASLNEQFADIDAKFETDFQVWAKGRVEALRAFKQSEAYTANIRRDSWGVYDQMFRLCGGKTWYQVFNSEYMPHIEEFITKNCAAIVAKRNAKIAIKLKEIGATEITGSDFARTSDGFDGVFNVVTDAGPKRIVINTIVAGGYNIQCLHQRTLVKVK